MLYDRSIAYDEDLAGRIRAVIGDDPAVTERKMFGGLAFLVRGNMAVAASGEGGLMVRVGADGELVEPPGVANVMMRGRAMTGWLRVADAEPGEAAELGIWIDRGVEVARSLPPKD